MNIRAMGTLAVVALGTLALAGCQQSAPAGLSDADKAVLRGKAERTMKTVNSKDYASWASDFTEDAEWLGANGPAVKGREAIQKSVAGGPVISDLALTQVDIDGRGDLAYVRGNFTLKVTPPGAPAAIEDKGKYIEIWRKQADGSWKASKVIVNSDNPMEPPPAAGPAKKK